jgi:phosphate transport system substrate-binding protein
MKPVIQAIVVVACFFSCQSEPDVTTISVRGSESLIETFRALVRDFTKINGEYQFTIEGGGSKTGLSGILQDAVDIGMSSFAFNLDTIHLTHDEISEYNLALDGIVLVINKENDLVNLTKQEVNAIFTGKVTNWSALEGLDRPIIPVIRDQNSGTQQFFQEYFSIDGDLLVGQVAHDNPEIAKLVQETDGGIGFFGFAYFGNNLRDVHLPYATTDSGFVAPTPKTLQNGTYPLKRYLKIYFRASNSEKLTPFLNYLKSEEAKRIIESHGLIPA